MDGSQKLPQRLLATLRERIAAGLPSPALATAIAAWMHFAVKTAHTPGAVLNDPLSADILAQARASNDSAAIIDNLLGIDKIFGSDLKTNSGFKAELLDGFRRLAAHPGSGNGAASRSVDRASSQHNTQEFTAMKMTFRWYGESDPVKLEYIRQIPGMYGIVSAIYDVPVGEVWPLEKLQALRDAHRRRRA